jgi:capsule polysaccharide modification protein KpsS
MAFNSAVKRVSRKNAMEFFQSKWDYYENMAIMLKGEGRSSVKDHPRFSKDLLMAENELKKLESITQFWGLPLKNSKSM